MEMENSSLESSVSEISLGIEGSADQSEDSPATTRPRQLSYAYARRHEVLVDGLDDQGRYRIACVAQPGMAVISELKRSLMGPLVINQVSQVEFDALLRNIYEKGETEATQVMDDLGTDLDLERLAHELPETTDLLEAADDAPIIRLINALLTQAISENASDIHLEAFEKESVVRLRVDGVLRTVLEPNRALHGALVSRLKVMSRLDIAEKRLPQDGRMSLRVAEHPVDVRVSTLPTQHGERVVLRLLDKESARLDLNVLGMRADAKKKFEDLIRTPHGIVLITGPTGSGKTTTLYSGLVGLDRRRMNILTVEDPVEYDLDGVGQTQISPRIGLTFASGLRSILRQDPDVVLVGEIRDIETADIAVQASLTGHLVLSTLHTNTAIGAVTRLVDMGVEPFLIASSMLGMLAQRLVRTLCKNCRESYQPSEREKAILRFEENGEDVEIYRPVGCAACDQTGYRGRVGIYELIRVDDSLRRMIHDGSSEADMLAYVRQSTLSLSRDGYSRVLSGDTSLEEVLRVTQS
jgi:general secretion pathway protein E